MKIYRFHDTKIYWTIISIHKNQKYLKSLYIYGSGVSKRITSGCSSTSRGHLESAMTVITDASQCLWALALPQEWGIQKGIKENEHRKDMVLLLRLLNNCRQGKEINFTNTSKYAHAQCDCEFAHESIHYPLSGESNSTLVGRNKGLNINIESHASHMMICTQGLSPAHGFHSALSTE